MNKTGSLKKELIKIIFFIAAIIISSFIVTNMINVSFNKRFKTDTLDKIKQYAQLVSFSTEKLIKDKDKIIFTDEVKLQLKESFKALQSGEVPGINDLINNTKYNIYECTQESKNIIFSSNLESNTINNDVLAMIIKTCEDKQISAKEFSDNNFHAFAPIKSKNEEVIGIVEIIENNQVFISNMKNKCNFMIGCISILILLWGLLKLLNIICKEKNKEYVLKKSVIITMAISALGMFSIIVFGGLDIDIIKSNKLDFTEISDTASDGNGNIYLIDNANTRILKINRNHELEYKLNGNKTGIGKFFYAVNIEADNNGNLYILNNTLDERGTYIAKEEILKYNSKGEFEKVIYSKEYEKEEMPLKQGNIASMQIKENSIYIFENSGREIQVTSYNILNDELKKEFMVDAKCDSSLIIDISLHRIGKSIVISTKNGELFTVDKNNNKSILMSSVNNSKFVPSEIESDDKGNVYCIDHGSSSILKINEVNSKKVLNPEILKSKGVNINFDPRLEHGYYRFSVNNNKLITSEHSYIIAINLDESLEGYFNYAKLPPIIIITKILAVGFGVIAVISGIYFINLKIESKRKYKKTNTVVKQSVGLVIIILIVSMGISGYFINAYENAFQSELETKLKRISFLKSKTINGDIVDKIKNVNQYMGEDYLEVRSQSKEGFNSFEDEWNSNYYSAIYKRVDEKIDAVVYSDDTNLLLFPMLFTTNDSKNIFRRVLDYGSVEYSVGKDFEGEWLSGFSPIRDSNGNIVAVLEIGADGNYYRIEKKAIVKDIVINIISMIAVLVFFFIEINIFMELIFKKKKSKLLKYDIKIIRFISFLIYSIMNIPLFFIPIVMENLLKANNFFNMSKEIATGLPLTAQMICLVIASGIGGTISDKSGWKKVFVSGIIFMMSGNICAGFSKYPLTFIIANGLIGFGLGLASVSTQSFIFYSRRLVEEEFDTNEVLAEFNSGSYAGANCGILFGSMIAEKIGYSNAFFVAIIIGIITLLFVFRAIPNIKSTEKEAKVNTMKNIEIIKLVFHNEILTFAILVLLPIIIVSFFVVHFFPIYSDSQGISSTTAGLGYMIQGVTVIYLGPVLTKIAIKHLKTKKTVILSSLIAFSGIILFAFKPTITMAFIIIFMLGLSEAVGQSARVNYFLKLKTSKLLGEGKSLAMFSVFENLGTIVGPTIFALILSSNISVGMNIYGGISLLFIIAFAIITLQFKSKSEMNIDKQDIIEEIS